MRLPEMSHSPAYYQDHHPHTVAAAAAAAASLPEPTPAAAPPGSVSSRPSSRDDAPTNPYASSHPWDASGSRHSHQHSPSVDNYPAHSRAPGDSIYSDPEPAAVAPPTFVSSAYLDHAPVLTPVPHSAGAMRKEERTRGSWTDRSSYMSSGDHHHAHSVSRAQKRPAQDEDPFPDDSQDALLMLFRLSLPVPLYSLCTALYTVFGLLFVLLVSPLRLCSCIPYLRKTSFRAQLCDLLVPQLHYHERLVRLRRPYRSSSTQSIYNGADDDSDSDPTRYFSMGGLVMVLLCSFLLSLAFLLLAWTAAAFWIFAMMLGNPDGTERRDDGRAAVLGVCKWWQLWLGKARKTPR
ncbi:hypothetical protein BDV59DRAFT_202026 [Aspergillus ambiguus]|uniref:uncharacterized protein n=1 Tax=Aspergillus ambiguus TaxID=176160 RepID=UPI003CCCE7FD